LTDDAAERFMRVVDRSIPVRPRTFLPAMAISKSRSLNASSQLHLAAGNRLYFDAHGEDGRTVRFTVGETPWTCDVALVPALRLLRHTRATSFGEMIAAVEPAKRLHLQALVTTLVAGDALWVEPDAPNASLIATGPAQSAAVGTV
jgi:hypothetical protein